MYNRDNYLKQYNSNKQYVVYCLKIKDKPIYKIGRTNNLKYRLINLNQSIYEHFDIFQLIKCENAYEYCIKEKWLHNELKYFNKKNEWYEIKDINIITSKLDEAQSMVCNVLF